jgi:hypothetical protein
MIKGREIGVNAREEGLTESLRRKVMISVYSAVMKRNVVNDR